MAVDEEPPAPKKSYRTVYNEFRGFDDEEQLKIYLSALRETGAYICAAEAIGCNKDEILTYRKAEPEFQLLCDDAFSNYNHDLIRAARSRAVDGWDNPIVGGRERNEVVAHTKHYSDSLTAMFLKRADASFREKTEVKVDASTQVSFDYSSYSKRVRDKMRELQKMIQEDNWARDRGEVVE